MMDLNKILPNFEMPENKKAKKIVGKTVVTFENGSQITLDDFEIGIDVAKPSVEDLGDRQKAVFNYLSENFPNGATAKELSVSMHNWGLVPSPERNSVHPRLRELVKLGLISVVGKKTCSFTDRTVSIYKNN